MSIDHPKSAIVTSIDEQKKEGMAHLKINYAVSQRRTTVSCFAGRRHPQMLVSKDHMEVSYLTGSINLCSSIGINGLTGRGMLSAIWPLQLKVLTNVASFAPQMEGIE
jgi:hypothetical protein